MAGPNAPDAGLVNLADDPLDSGLLETSRGLDGVSASDDRPN